jgi:gliding motility-associated-like protein
VNVVVFALPTGTLSQDEVICEGEQVSITFNLNGQQPFNLQYTVNGGAPVSFNNQVSGATLSFSPTADTQYCLTSITDSNNPACTAVVNSCIDVTVNALPTADITGNDAICAGDCINIPLTLTGTSPFTIEWEIEDLTTGITTPQADIVGALNGDVINYCFNNPSIVRITGITDSAIPSCTALINSEFDVSVQDVSDVVFAADASFCENGSLSLSFTFSQPAGGPWDITIEDALGNQTSFNGILPADLTGNVFETTINPTQSTTYSITAFSDATYPCSSFSGTANVTLVPLPTATIGPDQFFCPGDDIFLDLGLPTPGTFDVTYSDGVAQFDLFAVSDGYMFQVNPLVTTTYSFVSVTELSSGLACTAAPADVAVITVDDIPQISPVDTLCDATGDFYQISFEISGGDPLTYDVTEIGVGAGNISAGAPYIYTSAPIPSGSGATFEIDDANPCIPIELEILPYSCPVLTDAGTMDLVALNVCENEAAIAIWNNDGFLDGNDELMFILHNNPGETLGLVFAVDCNDAGFNDADTPLNFGNGVGQIQFGVTYYITAVAGNDDGTNDCVDLNNPNISVAAGTPVVFYEEPTVVISGGGVICEGNTIDLQLDFSGQGPWTVVYAIDGVDQPSISTPDNPYILTVNTTGDYSITSLSNAFCTGTSIGTVNVLVNPVPDAQIAGGGIICQGETFDLTIDFTGTGPWDFELIFEDGVNPASITPFNTAFTPFVLAVASEGTYSVANVIDATNCLNPDVISSEFLEVTDAPTASIADEMISLCEGESYDIVVSLTGSGPWDLIYTIDGVQQPTVNSAIDEITITATQAGIYELYEITDLTGCSGAFAGSVTIDVTPLPVANAGPDIVVCSEIDAILGAPFVPGLGYSWDDPDGLLSSDVIAQPVFNETNSSQVAEIYNFTLTVASGNCQSQDDVQITLESEPLADAGADQTICYEDSAQLNAQGGVSCSWTADPTLDDPAVCNPVASPLVNTTYTVTVQGANGCEASDNVLIEVTDPLVIDTLLITEQICFQACNGQLTLSADGTFGAATFDWVFPDGSLEQGDSFTDLCPGDYNITLTDDLGCNLSLAITLSELPEYVIQSALSPSAVCFEESNGIIDVLSPEAQQFELSPGEIGIPDGAGAYQFTDLEAGIYELTATDAFGCTDVVDVEVLSFPQINYNTGFTQTEICWEDNVSFTANANGGGGGFTFYWLDENGFEFGTGSPLNFVPSEETTLFGFAVDGNNCSSDTIAVTVVFPNPLTIELDPSETAFICEGDEITIEAELGGGVGFPAPVWTTLSNGQQISNQTSFTDIPEDDEGYVVTVTDGCAVPVTDTVFVVVNDTPEVLISYDAFEGCAPVEVQLINMTDENLVGSCLWQFGDGNILAACVDTVNYLFANPGEFTVSLTITSPDGCIGYGEMDAEVEVYPYPVANFTWSPNPPSNLENQIQLINQTQGGNTFFWDFDYLGTSPSPNPILELPPVDFGFFPVCLTATNIYGCTDSICENIVLQGVQLIYVPNAFTPDGDGRNDVFLPIVSGIDRSDYVFRIFDRWGQKIFETEKTDEPWLGNINGGGHYVQNDVYVWQIITKDLISGESKDYVGHVTIVR